MIRAEQVFGEKQAAKIVERLDGLTRLATLEQILASICVLIPAGLLLFSGEVRDSISAYYDMNNSEWFYVPITTAALLFVVNGVVKRAHPYNWMLGLALLLVLLFDHENATSSIHYVGAVLFFAGNAIVMLLFADTDLERRLRWPLVGVITAAMLAWGVFDWFTLFFAEWLSLSVIALHFFINSAQGRNSSRALAAA